MNTQLEKATVEVTEQDEAKLAYEAPQIESGYSPEQLDREFLYAGNMIPSGSS